MAGAVARRLPSLALAVEDPVRARHQGRRGLAPDLRVLGVGQRPGIPPIDGHRTAPGGEVRARLAEALLDRTGRTDLDIALPVLERLHPAGLVDAWLHRVGIEERVRIAERLGVGKAAPEQHVPGAGATPHRLEGAEALAGARPVEAVEELADVVILLPRIRDLEFIAVRVGKPLLVVGVLEQVAAIEQVVHVAVVDDAVHFIAPEHHVAIGRIVVVHADQVFHPIGHGLEVAGADKLARPAGDDVEQIRGVGAGGELGTELFEHLPKGIGNELDLGPGRLLPRRPELRDRPADDRTGLRRHHHGLAFVAAVRHDRQRYIGRLCKRATAPNSTERSQSRRAGRSLHETPPRDSSRLQDFRHVQVLPCRRLGTALR